MSQTDLNNLRSTLLSIPPDEVKKPYIPVDVYIQEAEDQLKQALMDKQPLLEHGMEWTYVETLPARVGACREAESLWTKDGQAKEESDIVLKEILPKAIGLRDGLLRASRYAFRKAKDRLAIVAIIAEGTGNDDLVQDLNDLSVLGRENLPFFKKIKYDTSNFELAAQFSKQLAESLATVKANTGTPEELDLRNRAYSYLKEAVDEIRECGKYTFATNPEKKEKYRSEYLAQNRTAANRNKNSQQE